MLGHKIILKLQNTQNHTMSDYNGTNHNGTKPDINNKRKTGKLSKTQKLTLLSNVRSGKESLGKLENILI